MAEESCRSTSGVRSALVTGATGFVGSRLVAYLQRRGVRCTAAGRDQAKAESLWADSVAWRHLDLASNEHQAGTCDGVDTVFHLAGYAHADDSDNDALGIHRRVTVEGTKALVQEAARAGVQRFMYLSSTKAMGEGGDRCLDEQSPAAPITAYGRAKRDAEQTVLEAGRKCGMRVCVLRLPLVYGPGVKGNLLHMIHAIDRGRFPPLPEVSNRRSMVHVDDVVQALWLAAESPRANGQIYLVTDGCAYSTRQIYEGIRLALGKRLPGWTVPVGILRLAANLAEFAGKVWPRPKGFNGTVLEKLLGSAWYSSDKISRELGYKPHHSFYAGLPEMVRQCKLGHK